MLSPFQAGLFCDSVDNWGIRITCISTVVAPHYSSGQAFCPRELIRVREWSAVFSYIYFQNTWLSAMECHVSWSGRAATEGKETLLSFTCLCKYQHTNFLAPLSLSSVLAFFLFPSFSLTLCPRVWAGKDLFLWVEFKEKKWSCNMPESSGLRKKICRCQLFLLLGLHTLTSALSLSTVPS